MAASGRTTREAYSYKQLSLGDDHLGFPFVEKVRSLVPCRHSGLVRGRAENQLTAFVDKTSDPLIRMHDLQFHHQVAPAHVVQEAICHYVQSARPSSCVVQTIQQVSLLSQRRFCPDTADKQAAFDDLAKMYRSIYLPTQPFVLRRTTQFGLDDPQVGVFASKQIAKGKEIANLIGRIAQMSEQESKV